MRLLHPSIDARFEFCVISVCAATEGPDPEFVSHTFFNAVDCVLEATIAMDVWCKVVGFG